MNIATALFVYTLAAFGLADLDIEWLSAGKLTVSGNHAAWGGGVHNDGSNSSASLTVTNSTFSGNNALVFGGAISYYVDGTHTLIVTNSTFIGNGAPSGGGLQPGVQQHQAVVEFAALVVHDADVGISRRFVRFDLQGRLISRQSLVKLAE